MRRFDLAEEDAWRAFLAATPRVLALYRGDTCPYSATFEKVFAEREVEGWTRVVRVVEEGGRGPVAEALDVDVTPTVGAWMEGDEAARLPGRLLLGITRHAYAKWLRGLP